MGGISLGQFFLIILVTTRLVRQWQNHHYQHSRLPSSTTLFFVLLAFTSTTTIGFIPTAAASCSGSKYGSLSNPFLNLGAFLPPDDGSSIGRRPYSLPLSPIVKVGDFWGARNLHFGCDPNELFFDSTHVFDGRLGCSQIYKMRVHTSSVHPRAHRQHSFQQPVRLSLRYTNAEHPFLVCTNDGGAIASSGTDVQSQSSTTPKSNSSHFGAERSGIHNHSRRQSPIQLLFSGAEMTATTSADDGDDLLGRSVAAADLFCGRKSFFDTEDLCAILNNPTSVVNQQQQRSRLAFKHRCAGHSVGRLDPRNDVWITEMLTNPDDRLEHPIERRLTTDADFDGFPWVVVSTSSPAIVYYTSMRSGGAEIWRMDLPMGTNKTQVTAASSEGDLALRPIVSPDGRWLVVECVLKRHMMAADSMEEDRHFMEKLFVRHHFYNRSAARLCVVDLREVAAALGPVQPRELVFTSADDSPPLDEGELFQFSGVSFADAVLAPKPILKQPPAETHEHNDESERSDGVGDTADGRGRTPQQKIVFSARRRSSSVGHQQLQQAGDTALYTSNVDGTEFGQLIDMSAANDHVAVDWRDNDGSRRRRRIAWVGADPDQMLSGRRLAKAVLMADFPSSSAPLAAETQQKRKKAGLPSLSPPAVVHLLTAPQGLILRRAGKGGGEVLKWRMARPRFSDDQRSVYFEEWSWLRRPDGGSGHHSQVCRLDLHTGSVVDQQQSLITPVKVSSDGSSAHSVVPLPADVHDGLLLYSTDSTVGYINMQSQQQQDNNGEVRAMVSGVWTHTTFGLPIESIFPLNSSSSRIQKTEEESSKGQKWNGNDSVTPPFESPFPTSSYSATDFCMQNVTNGLALYTVTKMAWAGATKETTLLLATVDVIRLRMPPWPVIRSIPSSITATRPLLVSTQQLQLSGNADSGATSAVSIGRYDGGSARFSPDCSTVVFGVVGGRKTAEEKDGDDGKEPTITTTSARGGGISTVTENDDVGRTKNQTVSAMAAISPTRDSINRRQPTTLTKPSFPANIATAFSSSNITWSALATLDLGIGEAREATRLLTKPLFGRVRSPAFMPDGRRVLFSSDHDSGQLGFPADGFPRQRTLYMTTGEGDTVAQVMAPVQFGDDDYENQHHHQKEEEGETMNAQQLLAGSGDLDIVYAPDAGACRLVWSRGGEKTTSGEAVTLLATATMAC